MEHKVTEKPSLQVSLTVIYCLHISENGDFLVL